LNYLAVCQKVSFEIVLSAKMVPVAARTGALGHSESLWELRANNTDWHLILPEDFLALLPFTSIPTFLSMTTIAY
jgi:hypothetical protein